MPMMFSSPGYPLNYGNNLYCTYEIRGPEVGIETYRIGLNFSFFDLESNSDYVEVSQKNSQTI